jgi:hypothetical protein
MKGLLHAIVMSAIEDSSRKIIHGGESVHNEAARNAFHSGVPEGHKHGRSQGYRGAEARRALHHVLKCPADEEDFGDRVA